MSKAILFLHSLEDVQKAVQSLGYPVELVSHDCRAGTCSVRVNMDEELESAFRAVRLNSSTHELAVVHH